MSEHYTVTNVSDEFDFTEIKPDISFEIFNTVAESIKKKKLLFYFAGLKRLRLQLGWVLQAKKCT